MLGRQAKLSQLDIREMHYANTGFLETAFRETRCTVAKQALELPFVNA